MQHYHILNSRRHTLTGLAILTWLLSATVVSPARADDLSTAISLTPPVAVSPAHTADRQPDVTAQAAMTTAIAAVKPALVKIHVVTAEYSTGREVKEEAFGSGVIIRKDGLVITNHHVAGDATYFTCTLADKEEMEATLVGTDALTDIAVLKLHPDTAREFPYATFGDSSAVHVGDRVFAMGSPLAFSQSVTMGMISNTEVVLPETFGDSFTLDGEDVGSVVRWISHDAQIFPGNSGGPLVNMHGEIIGINEVSFGLSGAIPGNLAWSVARQLIAHGHVVRSWIGLTVQPLLKSSTNKHGVLITGAIEGSPAANAGFMTGDLLLSLGAHPVEVRFKEELPLFNQMVMDLPAGKEIEAVVQRHGNNVTLHVTPLTRPPSMDKPRACKEWGMSASNITTITAKEKQMDSAAGVLVCGVTSGGPAGSAKPALETDDVICEVDNKPVKSLTDLLTITAAISAADGEPTPVTVAFRRRDEYYLTVVKVGVQEVSDPGQEVHKAWLPISTQVLTDELANALNLAGQTGVRVTQVFAHSAAEAAGLHVGDVITAVDDTAIEASQVEDVEVLPTMIRQYKIGSNVALTVYRHGEKLTLHITLPESPRQFRELGKYSDATYDFSVRDIAFQDRVLAHWDDTQAGVMTESVSEGGWAALGGLKSGDLICAIDNQPVQNVGALEAMMKKIAQHKPRHIVLQVKRGIFTAFLELHANY